MSLAQEKYQRIQGLYAITDPHLISAEKLIESIEQAILGGTRIVQYRNKLATKTLQLEQAQQLGKLCKQHDVCFIINDDPHLAQAVNADGVHIGKDDSKIIDARKQLGKQAIIGVSCYNQLANAQQALKQGADYIAFGRFFPSKTKPNAIQAEPQLLEQAVKQLPTAIVAIGGINQHNALSLINSGANALAVINDLFQDPDNIFKTAKVYQTFFNSI